MKVASSIDRITLHISGIRWIERKRKEKEKGLTVLQVTVKRLFTIFFCVFEKWNDKMSFPSNTLAKTIREIKEWFSTQ